MGILTLTTDPVNIIHINKKNKRTCNGKESEKEYTHTHIYITESLYCTLKTNTAL